MTKVFIQHENIECFNEFEHEDEAIEYANVWAAKLGTEWERDCDNHIVITD